MRETDKRRLILEALEKVLRGRRLDEVKVEQVAEAAGVGKGTVYLYFEDKEDLFFQMIQDLLIQESEDVALVAASALEPREKLLRAGEAMSRHIMRKGEFIRMMHAHGPKRKGGREKMMEEHQRRLNRILAEVFEEATKAGILRTDLDYAAVACLFKGMILQRSITCLNMGTDIPVKELLDLLLDGIGWRNEQPVHYSAKPQTTRI